jgi:hypothetical protein
VSVVKVEFASRKNNVEIVAIRLSVLTGLTNPAQNEKEEKQKSRH